jgi:hypothetical protein
VGRLPFQNTFVPSHGEYPSELPAAPSLLKLPELIPCPAELSL